MPEFDLDAQVDPNANGVLPHLTSMVLCSQAIACQNTSVMCLTFNCTGGCGIPPK